MSDKFGTRTIMLKGIANMSNEQLRHCRIGKVTPKPSKLVLSQGWKWPGYNALLDNDGEWKRQYLPMFPNFTTPNTAG